MIQLDLEQCVFTACLWEATARKAGNVHRYRDFENLTYLDFIQSAHAIAPVIANMVDAPIGETVLECIKATRRVVNTNTNLGIVLLLVPLSKLEWYETEYMKRLLNQTTVRDAELVYEAIRLACPGGLGEVAEQDVKNVPTETLLEVMRHGAERDLIARFYENGFMEMFHHLNYVTASHLEHIPTIEAAICNVQVHILSWYSDSLIKRKSGPEVAIQVRNRADLIRDHGFLKTDAARKAYLRFDRFLTNRKPMLNPGTTADLVTASLFVWLRTNKIDLNRPFTWKEYPGVSPRGGGYRAERGLRARLGNPRLAAKWNICQAKNIPFV